MSPASWLVEDDGDAFISIPLADEIAQLLARDDVESNRRFIEK
jgi:hypothetical protein